jgi:hypothetical protein
MLATRRIASRCWASKRLQKIPSVTDEFRDDLRRDVGNPTPRVPTPTQDPESKEKLPLDAIWNDGGIPMSSEASCFILNISRTLTHYFDYCILVHCCFQRTAHSSNVLFYTTYWKVDNALWEIYVILPDWSLLVYTELVSSLCELQGCRPPWSSRSVLAIGPKFRGFKPGRGRWIF